MGVSFRETPSLTFCTGFWAHYRDAVRGSSPSIEWIDVSAGHGGYLTWNLAGGNMPSSWNPTFKPQTTFSCPSRCVSTLQTISTASTDKPSFYLDQVAETATDGISPNFPVPGDLNWNLLQIDLTKVDTTKGLLSFTLGGGSGTSGPFQAEFTAPNGTSAYFPRGPNPKPLGVGAQTLPFQCISVTFGTYATANGLWNLADSFDTQNYLGASLTLNPALVIPSTNLLKSIEAAVGDAADKSALTKIIGPILQGIQNEGVTDPNQFAAILAQMEIETDFSNFTEGKNDDVAERDYGIGNHPVDPTTGYNKFGNSLPNDGKIFKGKGLIQITGRSNYISLGKALGMDLVDNPQSVTDPTIAAEIASYGMVNGTFVPANGTLNSFITSANQNYRQVRSMINPNDS